MTRRKVSGWMGRLFTRRPLVSVILPSFNHAPFVAEAVGSVLGQSLRELELIVMDDASTDATPDIVASMQDPRLRLLRLEANRAVHPRNLALSLAQGRYVAFQNSDDVWHPDKIEKQVEAMEAGDAPSVCFTETALIGADSRPLTGSWADSIFQSAERPAEEWLRRFFDLGNCLAITSAMVRRADLLALGGFRASLIQLGDFDLWIRMAAIGHFRTLPETLTGYRILETNLSAPSTASAQRSQIELAQVLERYIASPILERLPDIFPDIPADTAPGARKIALALRAIASHGSGPALFADRTIASVLDSAQERAEAVAYHGTGFLHDFIARRGRSEFRIHPHA